MLERARVTTCLPTEPARRGAGSGGADEVGQAGQVRLAVENEHVGLLVGEQVLGEAGAERGQPLGDGGEPLPGAASPRWAPLRTKAVW
ncbi:MAG: hypothetical protein R3C69_02650 [Geminicoccaceae bacterium]